MELGQALVGKSLKARQQAQTATFFGIDIADTV